MGACDFVNTARRGRFPLPRHNKTVENGVTVLRQAYGDWPDAKTAFEHLCDNDRYENGHSYSGGIGMKREFRDAGTVDTLEEAQALAQKLLAADDRRFCDKWGPCGCITVRTGEGQFVFFGFAAS